MNDTMVTVSSETLEYAQKSLAGVPGGVQKAVKEALYRAGDKMKTDAVQETKQKYHLLPGEIRKHLLFKKAAGVNMSVSLLATGRRKPISEYKVQGKGKDLRVAVRTGGMKTLKTGFLVDGNGKKTAMWLPKGEGTPAMPVISPSVPQAIAHKETRATMEKQARERFETRLRQNVTRIQKDTFK
ncbi:MAG: hypothetical protein LBQ42_07480 [Synergistaceae bacterium]|jgi:hypothetical protein|nr:hypothetical protein [Synergistaceae bacterium]